MFVLGKRGGDQSICGLCELHLGEPGSGIHISRSFPSPAPEPVVFQNMKTLKSPYSDPGFKPLDSCPNYKKSRPNENIQGVSSFISE